MKTTPLSKFYQCSNKKGEKSRNLSHNLLDKLFYRWKKRYPQYFWIDVYKRQSQSSDHRAIEKLEKERTQLKEKKKGVLDAFFTKSISEDDMTLMNAEYDRRMAELTERIVDSKEKEGSGICLLYTSRCV